MKITEGKTRTCNEGMFPAKQCTGEKTSGDFCTTEFPHPGGTTLRSVAETEIEKQQQRQQIEVYLLTNYNVDI